VNGVSQRSFNLKTAAMLLLVVLVAGGLANLGCWQLRRGHEKQALIDGYERAMRATPIPLTRQLGATSPAQWTPVQLRGSYVAERQLLLDNQSQGEQAGFDVWTPLRSDEGALVLVDRGWVPHGQRADIPAPPAGPLELHGLWRALPVPGLRLQADNCSLQGWPRVVEYPTADDLRCLLGEAPLAGVVLLAPDVAGGFVRDWHPSPGFPPERHYAYAAQWFALAVTLLILSLRMWLKRTR
jgi:cytochrome oxidase assembly protein ShyY1